jgi:acyl-CoA thioesterase-1
MLNASIYHLASGQAFFSGVALVFVAVAMSSSTAGRWCSLGRTVVACAGMCLIAASATPLPAWFYAIAGAVSIAWLGAEGRSRARWATAKRGLRVAVTAACSVGVAMELPFHLMPELPRMGRLPLFVVGDSISAGMGGEAETWPAILARRHDVSVHDLSIAGADVAKASRSQAGRVAGSDALVIAEIGGNDVLGATSPEDFDRGLDGLLQSLRRGGRTVVMLELPLPPFYNEYGAIQRRLARRHGVALVPKRVLLGVLTAEGATVDTIHLSAAGQGLMAEAMWGVIRPAFGP